MAKNNIVNTFEDSFYDQNLKHHHKVINDPIHGYITLDDYTIDFIDTVQFQRLRELKQLGVLYYVFPGASHNRFEHSIGVSHLAGTLVERFAREQPELEISSNEIKCVKLAGLCHDLGKKMWVVQKQPNCPPPGSTWTHEQGSERMLEYLVDDNQIDIEKDEINFIKDLIAGEPRESSRVINNEICYHHKEVYNLYEMFHTRHSLHRQIYTHRVGTAIELMVVDAFLAANDYLKIADMIDNPEDYLHLTDDIVHTIEKSKCPELEKARHIIKSIRKRDLYKFVDEFLIPPELEDRLDKHIINAQNIVNHQTDNAGLTERDVIVRFTKINYAMNERNPVDSIRFYSKFNEQESFNISKQKVSYMIPSKFQDITIRVFTRDPLKMQAIQKAFRKCLKEITHISDLDPTVSLPEGRLNSKRFRSNGHEKV
ncbi:hypothetical protein RO3G_05813 [Rhizopus delemar RA 99-880]|uniref:HD domain-containing protein n=1 Tax=Rhizopus delemar (strain RA 99-880 / ATCC MYA-4621 / FGSC 9543 / NRRL 43880) TaxID=246409 RepID=I1BY28_RHIO9|nr:hypothetical protein RO3G_05813 [Rhizopus delemar RA 99-880]|eukprot:EIE81108.1 hypothetical protein RO3G_05813 [Rhizopus delemar RA 99-880]